MDRTGGAGATDVTGFDDLVSHTPVGRGGRMSTVRHPDLPVTLGVFILALACRTALLLRNGGLRGNSGYDPSVYFAAADALVHGRMPYRDFTLLHPPGIMLALAPFAALTRVVDDMTAFLVGNLVTILVGASCAVLVVRISRRLGLGRWPSVVGGLFYATWFGAVDAEFHARLEPWGNLFVLAGVLVALHAQHTRTSWRSVTAGVLLGTALTIKIWWIVPVLVVLVWHGVVTRSVAAFIRIAAGATAATTVICLPFFVVAPRRMWDSVVLDQLGRRRAKDLTARVTQLSTLTRLDPAVPHSMVVLGLIAGGLLLAAAGVCAWRVRSARMVVIVLAAQLVVLLAAPSWFLFYADYASGALSLTLAAGVAGSRRLGHLGRTGMVGWLPTLAAAVVTLVVLTTPAGTSDLPGQARLSQAVTDSRCVMSDSPMGLIEVDALSRDFTNGCRDWVDVTGRTYGPDKLAGRTRWHNPRWQADLRRYLRSGNAVLVVRRHGSGITARTQAAISRDGILVRADGQTIYRVTHR